MVLNNGENVPPAVVEQHLVQDPIILQAMVIADNRPYVSALIVSDMDGLHAVWRREMRCALPHDWQHDERFLRWFRKRLQWDEHDLASYMQVQRFAFVDEEWTQNNGLVTPTLKLKRRRIAERYADVIKALYADAKREEDA